MNSQKYCSKLGHCQKNAAGIKGFTLANPAISVGINSTGAFDLLIDGTVKIGKLNVDENPQSAGGFGISSIPAVLLFKDGKVVDTLVGVQPKERYEAALGQVAA